MTEAGVYSVNGINELNQMVFNLADGGFRIVSVLDTQNGMYHVVAQKEAPYVSYLNVPVLNLETEEIARKIKANLASATGVLEIML